MGRDAKFDMLTELAFTQAYRKYGPSLVQQAKGLTAGSADSEDIAQDAWAEAWKARDRLDMPGLWAWLRSVLKRVWWWRMNPKRKAMPDFTMFGPEHDEPMDGGQDMVVQIAQVEQAAKGLSASQSRAIAYAMVGIEPPEVAARENISLSGASDALRKAIAALRLKWRIA